MSDKEYIEYLRNKIEELQDENTQLKIEIDRLKRNSIQYIPSYWEIYQDIYKNRK
jgi:regulator of replication initiation timing